jgi:hypothetical protein
MMTSLLLLGVGVVRAFADPQCLVLVADALHHRRPPRCVVLHDVSTNTPTTLLTAMVECGSHGKLFIGLGRAYLALVGLDDCDDHSADMLRTAFLDARAAGWFDTKLCKM